MYNKLPHEYIEQMHEFDLIADNVHDEVQAELNAKSHNESDANEV